MQCLFLHFLFIVVVFVLFMSSKAAGNGDTFKRVHNIIV